MENHPKPETELPKLSVVNMDQVLHSFSRLGRLGSRLRKPEAAGNACQERDHVHGTVGTRHVAPG